jgi:hypothetical protein
MTKIDTEIDKTVALLDKLAEMKARLPATSKCFEKAIESAEDWLCEIIESKVVTGSGDIKTIIPELLDIVYCKIEGQIQKKRVIYIDDGSFVFANLRGMIDYSIHSPGIEKRTAKFLDYGKTWAYSQKELEDRADVITVTGSAGFDGIYRTEQPQKKTEGWAVPDNGMSVFCKIGDCVRRCWVHNVGHSQMEVTWFSEVNGFSSIYLSDYGKTWSYTREELNGKINK